MEFVQGCTNKDTINELLIFFFFEILYISQVFRALLNIDDRAFCKSIEFLVLKAAISIFPKTLS